MKKKNKKIKQEKVYKEIEQHLNRGGILKSGNCIIGKCDSFGRFLESGPRGEYAQLFTDNDPIFDEDEEFGEE